MASLDRTIRKQLEKTIRVARAKADEVARAAITQLGVADKEARTTATAESRALRLRLRARARQLGDHRDRRTGTQRIDRLVEQCAYETWNRMLFARFLAETGLLLHPDHEAPVTLDEVKEIANAAGKNWVELASIYAERMLPQIFRQGDPVLRIGLPAEAWLALEECLASLPKEVFLADDSLGWVYQFWQAARKEEVDEALRAGGKAGADEIPAKTQLFTENYMVEFLLHNTLGAWWAGKQFPDGVETETEDLAREACSLSGVDWAYLRFVRDGELGRWRPAAGTFKGWPATVAEITILDPCMGSGHFLVVALPILATMRASEESLTHESAYVAVLRDNLFGLEIDERCTQIAAFNLGFSAWRKIGVSPLPSLQLACSGLAPNVRRTDWLELADRVIVESAMPAERNLYESADNLFSARIREGFVELYELFEKAPTLGSLLDPRARKGSLYGADFDQLETFFDSVISATVDGDLTETAVAASGMAKSAELLSRHFTLVATNVPYLGRGKQVEALRNYCDQAFPDSKADLATCFVERCLAFCDTGGSVAVVTPQNWLFLGTYRRLRKGLIERQEWNAIARLGSGAFETISGAVVNVALLVLSAHLPGSESTIVGIDVSSEPFASDKAAELARGCVVAVDQRNQLSNPDCRLMMGDSTSGELLSTKAQSFIGFQTGDTPRFVCNFWEVSNLGSQWEWFQTTTNQVSLVSGLDSILRWDGGTGEISEIGLVKGREAWGKLGVCVRLVGHLPCALYFGQLYDQSCAAVIPNDADDLPALWSFCSDPQFNESIRKLDQALKVTNATLAKVPFHVEHWRSVAAAAHPSGLPSPTSDDPTQWLFSGHPASSSEQLQVAVARLLGFAWPRQKDISFPGCVPLDEDGLDRHSDDDGIVCLSPVRSEPAAATRLRALLADAFGPDWSSSKERELLTDVGESQSLDDWLRNYFFAQHCTLFQQRPFIWHIWDGRLDGFNALVSYHKLVAPKGQGRKSLEKLIFTYLGDWIDRQRADVALGVDGSEARLAAAEYLKGELECILDGERPYDLFVRWKPLHEQPIGWDPDVNDGVRVNMRPFWYAQPLGARGFNASILRTTPRVNYGKDRGKEPKRARDHFPWFWRWDEESNDFLGADEFDGNRWNDLHYSRMVKDAARVRYSAAVRKERSK